MKKLFLIFILALIVFISCKKNETTAPVVTIFLPTSTDSFYVADSVRVNFNIADINLRSYKIIISNYLTRKIYYTETTAVDSANITIDKRVFVAVNADTTALLNILGIDKNGNTGNGNVVFKMKK